MWPQKIFVLCKVYTFFLRPFRFTGDISFNHIKAAIYKQKHTLVDHSKGLLGWFLALFHSPCSTPFLHLLTDSIFFPQNLALALSFLLPFSFAIKILKERNLKYLFTLTHYMIMINEKTKVRKILNVLLFINFFNIVLLLVLYAFSFTSCPLCIYFIDIFFMENLSAANSKALFALKKWKPSAILNVDQRSDMEKKPTHKYYRELPGLNLKLLMFFREASSLGQGNVTFLIKKQVFYQQKLDRNVHLFCNSKPSLPGGLWRWCVR